MNPLAVQANGVTFRYPGANSDALNQIHFSVRSGEFFSVVGPNGGGKSTLFKLLSTLIRPQSGELFLNGLSLLKSAYLVRERIGVVFNPLHLIESSRFMKI